ncbi:ASCH domain-containing protein [Hydrogenophaga crocea]|jgi:predicted transcriptional regulator|uniref:ASCH domain-containing protein n=1 Tax=Hydrogenophaga crocea TaxID=2716225 RepID=A0A6G8IJK4_9BURK|nr:ASCH domain-containing protein [Hydrogenophaga crocea]QIM53208.1 ASCH domain-containing protein [Hydrogenophaga crocea]
MTSSKTSFAFEGDVALISVHPVYVEKIMSGEKNLEFRRIWPKRAIDTLVVYATHPQQRLAAIVQVAGVVRVSKTALWRVAAAEGGGITRQALFDYFEGKELGVAIRLGKRIKLGSGLPPKKVFGASFRPPQSFRYLSDTEKLKVRALLEAAR